MESSVSFGSYDQSHERVVEELKSKISYLEAEKIPSDEAKKYSKLTASYDSLQKEVANLKETIEEIMMKKNELADHNKEL
jgi:predicted  nucleic acid-binding Zn-ribbon protein